MLLRIQAEKTIEGIPTAHSWQMDFLDWINALLSYSLSAQPPGKIQKWQNSKFCYDNPNMILLLSSCFPFYIFSSAFSLLLFWSSCSWFGSHSAVLPLISLPGIFNEYTLVSPLPLWNQESCIGLAWNTGAPVNTEWIPLEMFQSLIMLLLLLSSPNRYSWTWQKTPTMPGTGVIQKDNSFLGCSVAGWRC